MKKCSTCQETLPYASFSRRGEGYQGNCKECNKAYYKKYYAEQPKEKARILAKTKEIRRRRQELINEKKSVPCTDCNVQYAPHVMQFDHLDGQDKLFNISTGKNLHSWEKIEAEIAKCEVVCANCHAERTFQRRQTGVGYAGIAR